MGMKRMVGLMILAVFLPGLAGVATAEPSWYIQNGVGKWKYRQRITIQHTNIVSDLTNFPVLINMTTNIWKYTANGGHVRQTNGWDFLFTGSNGTSKLSHEIEKYTYTNGELTAWVKVPALSSSADTEIFIYYGNESCPSQWDVNATWDANYAMVQHLAESPSNGVAGHIDSTPNANNGTPSGFGSTSNSTTNPERDVPDWDTKKKIDGADIFDGSDDYVSSAHAASLNITNTITLEAWIKPTIIDSGVILSKGTDMKGPSDENGYSYYLSLQSGGTQIGFSYMTNGLFYYSDNHGFVADTWHHVAATHDAAAHSVLFYADGVGIGSRTSSQTPPTNASPVTIAKSVAGVSPSFNGVIDEVRISNVVRSSGWIKAGAVNQASPGVGGFFASVGDEEWGVRKGTIFSTY